MSFLYAYVFMQAANSKRIEETFSRVLKDISPTKDEIKETTAHANMLMERLRQVVPRDVEIITTGSIAKGTNLRGTYDMDIFMLFGKERNRDEIVRKGLAYAKRIARGKNERIEIKYAEHPYVRLYLDALNLKADIVPAMKIDNIEEMATAVDRSPLHTEFVNSNFTDRQRGDVRLLKYLLKAHNIYGAELKVKGFSGYLCEILVYHYGSLAKLLERAAGFKLPLYIDPVHKKESYDKFMVKRYNSDFVVIDPVDPNRNVAAAVSKKSLAKFAVLARMFIEKPDIKMFYGQKYSSDKAGRWLKTFVAEAGLTPFIVQAGVPDKSEDVTWPQLKKVSDLMLEQLKKHGFEVYIAAPFVQGRKGILLFLVPDYYVKSRLLKGPDALMTRATGAFIRKHKEAFGFVFRDSMVYALEKSRYPDFGAAMKGILASNAVHGRKDVKLKGAKLIMGKIPKEYEEQAHIEVRRRLEL